MALLYIANFFGSEYLCIGWVWYLDCDMQFYIFSFIITILYAINRKYGFIAILSTAIASVII